MHDVCIFGSTGSVGCQTLDVISRHPDAYRVRCLTANNNHELLWQQCKTYQPDYVVMVDELAARELAANVKSHNLALTVLSGEEALTAIFDNFEPDIVVAAIVGAAGLPSTLAAIKRGARVLIANKEPLVMMGAQIMSLAQSHDATILPVDSEHNAIFQCLPRDSANLAMPTQVRPSDGVAKLWLTGSGGPFRQLPLAEFANITTEQALRHPNWSMGRKITVDSATMMNKGLELVEASHLFALPASAIEILLQPQSVIHSMVEYVDGSVIAQMGSPDMRIPIAHCLAWPQRIESGSPALSLLEHGRLEFAAPDYQRFPCLKLAQQALEQGGSMPAVVNAANEQAVELFLDAGLPFIGIAEVIARCMADHDHQSSNDLDLAEIIAIDNWARRQATQHAAALTV